MGPPAPARGRASKSSFSVNKQVTDRSTARALFTLFSPGGLTLAAQTSEARGLADDHRARVAADVDIEMVRVQVLYFARAREATGGMTEESFEVGGAAADTDALRAALVAKHPSLQSVLESCVLAVNQEYATGNTALSEGCEVAIIPPISGG